MTEGGMIFALILLFISLTQTKLVFEDNFDTLDFKKWKHQITLAGGGNWEFQIYDNNRSTTFVKNSKLNIKPIPTDDKIGANNVRNGYTYSVWGGSPADMCTANFDSGCERTSDGFHYINPVMSGKLTTIQSFKYGRIQVKAKLPKGDWLWPAIWLMPRRNQYGSWPSSGQIDIMESRGNVNYPKSAGGGPERFCSTLHWGTDWSTNQFSKTRAEYQIQGTTLAEDFHIYGLYWDNKTIYTYLDNDTNKVLQVNHSAISYWQRGQIKNRANPWQYSPNKCAPFDTQFFLILNLAIGGTIGYFADGVASKPWVDSSQRASAQFYDNKGQWIGTWNQSSSFQIDSVKIWDLEGQNQEQSRQNNQIKKEQQ